MPDQLETLLPTTGEELLFTLSQALLRGGKKQFHSGRNFTAEITAAHLIEQMRKHGYVILKKPPMPAHSSGNNSSAGDNLTE